MKRLFGAAIIVLSLAAYSLAFWDVNIYHPIEGSGSCVNPIWPSIDCSDSQDVWCLTHPVGNIPVGEPCGYYEMYYDGIYDNCEWSDSGYDAATIGGPWDINCYFYGQCIVQIQLGTRVCFAGPVGGNVSYQVAQVNTSYPCP